MSIARVQIVDITNRIIEEAFKDGIILTVDQVVAKAMERLKQNGLGQPTTKYRPAPYRGRSIPEDWNLTVDEINTDLSVLYKEHNDQANRILTDFDYFEVEKRKLERVIGELEDQIEELLLLNNNVDGYLYSIYDQFRNINLIDAESSSAWVDLNLGHVTLPEAKTGNVKLDLSHCEITGAMVTSDGLVSSTEVESLTNIVDDNINTSWIQKIVTNKPTEIKYQVYVKLDGDTVTRVLINPHVPAKTEFEVLYTEDNLNWKQMGTQVGLTTMAFDFSAAWFKGLKINVTKSTHDEIETGSLGEQLYVYYIGITNLSLLKIGYEDVATIQSNALTILDRQGHPVEIDKLSLAVTESVPTSCSINYYVALQKKDGEVLEWQPILPFNKNDGLYPKVIDLKSLSSSHDMTNLLANSAVQYTQGDQGLFNGLKFYSLNNTGSIPDTQKLICNVDSPILYKGIRQFRTESFYQYVTSGPELHMPTPTDWINLPVDPASKMMLPVKTKYVDVENNLHYSNSDTMYSYRSVTSLYFNTSQMVTSTLKMTSDSDTAILNVAVYVNGLPVLTDFAFNNNTTKSITWPFTSGWNDVIILAYKPDGCSTDLTFNASSELNPFLTSNQVQADPQPMTYVSLFEYLYNVYEKDTAKYSVSDDNLIIISEYQKNQGSRYSFIYKYSIDQGYANTVFFKAELSRSSDPSISPKLINYKIRVS